MMNRRQPAVLDVSDQRNSGRVLAALLIYLAAFAFSLLLFLRGFHSLAFVALVGVWAVLAFWLQKGDR